MGTMRSWLLALAIAALMAPLGLAAVEEQPAGPHPRWRGVGPGRRFVDRDRPMPPAAQAPGRPGAPRGPKGPRGSFIEQFLQNHPKIKEMAKAQREKQRAVMEQLKKLHSETRRKIQEAATPEERQKVIEEAKAAARNLLLQLTDNAIAFRKKMLGLLEEHKEDAVNKAVERIFTRRPGGAWRGERSRGRPMGPGGHGPGPRRRPGKGPAGEAEVPF